ncbi:hypothetical protein DPMN_031704 [Dreissena polymorpha]|uniref:Uncharacterized protein n=1 Tax=Dreissena polymorpha TaxID=45954 RepID=A0A9D4M2D6_DREPO|nr:hypothetical protein DPMN_031704 [Dreissena polymorpha]
MSIPARALYHRPLYVQVHSICMAVPARALYHRPSMSRFTVYVWLYLLEHYPSPLYVQVYGIYMAVPARSFFRRHSMYRLTLFLWPYLLEHCTVTPLCKIPRYSYGCTCSSTVPSPLYTQVHGFCMAVPARALYRRPSIHRCTVSVLLYLLKHCTVAPLYTGSRCLYGCTCSSTVLPPLYTQVHGVCMAVPARTLFRRPSIHRFKVSVWLYLLEHCTAAPLYTGSRCLYGCTCSSTVPPRLYTQVQGFCMAVLARTLYCRPSINRFTVSVWLYLLEHCFAAPVYTGSRFLYDCTCSSTVPPPLYTQVHGFCMAVPARALYHRPSIHRFTVSVWLYLLEHCFAAPLCSVLHHSTWDAKYKTPLLFITQTGLKISFLCFKFKLK